LLDQKNHKSRSARKENRIFRRLTSVFRIPTISIKPWVTGKLDYPPPVADLADVGYKLLGGRIDLLENRPVAAIVYQYQGHFINVFVWPAASHAIDFDVQSQQGYSLCGWNKASLNYLIISELSPADMEKFEDQLRDRTD
jgi:anti-sigma factor RsiW